MLSIERSVFAIRLKDSFFVTIYLYADFNTGPQTNRPLQNLACLPDEIKHAQKWYNLDQSDEPAIPIKLIIIIRLLLAAVTFIVVIREIVNGIVITLIN
jgi:hypothetical protein